MNEFNDFRAKYSWELQDLWEDHEPNEQTLLEIGAYIYDNNKLQAKFHITRERGTDIYYKDKIVHNPEICEEYYVLWLKKYNLKGD